MTLLKIKFKVRLALSLIWSDIPIILIWYTEAESAAISTQIIKSPNDRK